MTAESQPFEPTAAVDKGPGKRAQGALPDAAVVHRGRLRVRTLVAMRWLVIVAELAALAVMGFGFRYDAPYELALTLIGASAWLNLLTSLASAGQRTPGDWEAAGHLGFDVLQLAGLIFLMGGISNPFVVMTIAPLTLAASTLPNRQLAALGGVAALAFVILALETAAPPWTVGEAAAPSLAYRLTAAAALALGASFIAGYARRAATEAARMELALNVTQTVLAREQRLSALGGLAAAAAHELGTPLATISIVAKEMSREAKTPQVREDADLLVSQAERCREILRRLGAEPDATDAVHERMSLLQFVHEVIEPHMSVPGIRVEAIVTGQQGAEAPDMFRMPEVLHAMTSFVENAVDFAKSEVLITARFDTESVSVEVRDDGPGFAPDVLAKLGEPYVTTRQGVEGGRTGHIGMGLGFFIAKTLLERTGAVVTFQNGRPQGAIVAARWPRSRIEALAV
jgi:two-component system, sensor histidine kinase RegB